MADVYLFACVLMCVGVGGLTVAGIIFGWGWALKSKFMYPVFLMLPLTCILAGLFLASNAFGRFVYEQTDYYQSHVAQTTDEGLTKEEPSATVTLTSSVAK